PSVPISPVPPNVVSLPEASLQPVGGAGVNPAFPQPANSGDVGGWMYLNLHNGGSASYSTTRHSQNWVGIQMTAEGRFGVDFWAAALGNGCSPAVGVGATIGPAANSTPIQ
ncbi:MAG: hypothetical protein ABI718_14545, partial [Acidobacteriota bacterium]